MPFRLRNLNSNGMWRATKYPSPANTIHFAGPVYFPIRLLSLIYLHFVVIPSGKARCHYCMKVRHSDGYIYCTSGPRNP